MPFADDLLEQARHLARREPKRPKQASLRRAVSTAYYALFHLLIAETVLNWKRPEERAVLARMFEHSTMRRACISRCNQLSGYFHRNLPSGSDGSMAKELHRIADTFVRMQQERHAADYDNATKWTRTDVISKVDSVANAFQSWRTIRSHAMAQDFLVSLLLKER